jgi:hypothetical protein
MRELPTIAELKETASWILAIVGAVALIYDIGWYGSLIASIH